MNFFEQYGQPTLHPTLDINSYINEGYVKVCEVSKYQFTHDNRITWEYVNINFDLMYDDHCSWTYFIVTGNEIVKNGETGSPLGIKAKGKNQPVSSSSNRFGRLRGGDNTDAYIRETLQKDVSKGFVSLWAKRCPVVMTEVVVGGKEQTLKTTFHKTLEQEYFNHFKEKGVWPRLNKSKK
jgi:hypothetical protein